MLIRCIRTVLVPLLLAASAGCAGVATETLGQRRVAVDTSMLLGQLALEDERREDAARHFLDAALASDDPALAEQTARMAHQLSLSDVGLAAVRRWQSLAPDDERAYWFAGVFYARNQRIEESIEAFETLIRRIAPDSPETGLALVVEGLGNEPNTRAATAIMQALTTRFPGTPEGHFGLARIALRSGDFETALTNAEAATRLDPAWLDAQLLYARTLLVSGDTDASLALAERLVAEFDDVEVELQYAELLLSAGRSEQAEARLNAILDENPGMPEAIRALAFLTLTTERYDEAENLFNDLRGNTDYRDEAFYYLGRIAEARDDHLQATRAYARVTDGTHAVEAQVRTALIILAEMGDPASALRHLEEFGNANPRFASEMLLARGRLLVQMGETERALALLDAALEANAEDASLRDAHVRLHVMLVQNAIDGSRLDEAGAWLDAGLERYPGNVSLRYSQALLLQQQGRMRRAVAVLESLVAESPDNPALLNALGYLLTDQFDRHDEAREYIQRALAMNPDSPAIIDSMGWVLFKLGQYEAALGYLERAYRLETDPEIAAHLVDAHWALDQRDEARAVFEAAIGAAPDSAHLQEVRRRLDL